MFFVYHSRKSGLSTYIEDKDVVFGCNLFQRQHINGVELMKISRPSQKTNLGNIDRLF